MKKASPSRAVTGLIMALAGFALMGTNGHALTAYNITPHGILDLELPYRGAEWILQVLAQWGEAGRAVARQNSWWDFLFMAVYTLAFVWCLQWLISRNDGWIASAGKWLLNIAWWPAALDVMENAGMLYWINTGRVPAWTAGAVLGASAFKWLLVFLFLIYGVVALASALSKKARQ